MSGSVIMYEMYSAAEKVVMKTGITNETAIPAIICSANERARFDVIL